MVFAYVCAALLVEPRLWDCEKVPEGFRSVDPAKEINEPFCSSTLGRAELVDYLRLKPVWVAIMIMAKSFLRDLLGREDLPAPQAAEMLAKTCRKHAYCVLRSFGCYLQHHRVSILPAFDIKVLQS